MMTRAARVRRSLARTWPAWLAVVILVVGCLVIGVLDGWGRRDDWVLLILLAGFFAIAIATDIFIRYVFRRRP